LAIEVYLKKRKRHGKLTIRRCEAGALYTITVATAEPVFSDHDCDVIGYLLLEKVVALVSVLVSSV
jgi:hypothetical protein